MANERIGVLQGPNLNLLGTREPDVYGSATLADVQADLDHQASDVSVRLEHFQANSEGALVDWIHDAAKRGLSGFVVNAGAYTHTSVAMRDALVGVGLPFVEVHISNVYAREEFRKTNLLADVAVGAVVGLGVVGYGLALRGLIAHLRG